MPTQNPESESRVRPPLFRALGRKSLPETLTAQRKRFHLVAELKHDSWAATGIYHSDCGRKIIVKFNRRQSIFGFPMGWLGRALAHREQEMLSRLVHLIAVPNSVGPISINGVVQTHAVGHDYVEGHPLSEQEWVNDQFFPILRETLNEIHRLDLAYVDLHKRENIIVGDDGRPYLVDFQICFTLPNWWPGNSAPLRWILRLLQNSDNYHLRKHWAWNRSDQCGYDIIELKRHLPWWIRAHRSVAKPLRTLRRRFLVALGIRKGRGESISEANPEDAVRRKRDMKQRAA